MALGWVNEALKDWDNQIHRLIQQYFPSAGVQIFYDEQQQFCMVHVTTSHKLTFVMRYPQVAAGFVSCPIWAYLDGRAYYLDPFLYPELERTLELLATGDATRLQAEMDEVTRFYEIGA